MTHGGEGGRTGLIVIDMLSPYEHADADDLARSVEAAVPAISALIERGTREGAEVVYVNDNYGDWNSSQDELVERALNGRHPELVEPILPPDGASFVIKPRHSIFYKTPLDFLLERQGVDRIVLTGQVTEQCILYSALDAHVRELSAAVPEDAVAHIHEELARAALKMMEVNMHVEVTTSERCRLARDG